MQCGYGDVYKAWVGARVTGTEGLKKNEANKNYQVT